MFYCILCLFLPAEQLVKFNQMFVRHPVHKPLVYLMKSGVLIERFVIDEYPARSIDQDWPIMMDGFTTEKYHHSLDWLIGIEGVIIDVSDHTIDWWLKWERLNTMYVITS